ncbi:K02A2.6-like [Cordylochernes scorpioides]|uniref:RNA-directed DNA polymerase n=1 Tax=Cordylochernes scorpioides TaxID=51811 RepID=A0ABY6LS03_9ARAC|nr:K02A2.6-like [Cordylochernes scorpioides]
MTSVIQPMDKGVIKNLKHFYRRFLVENILTGDSEALKIKLDVLQASRLCKKAWDQVTSETIKHCFKKAGFVKKEEDEENADDIIAETIVDGWEDVISNPTISYDDFLNVDDDVAVCGEITDADIIAEVLNHNIEKQDGDEASGDEDESSVAGEMNVPSAAEATNYIMQLRRFFESKNDLILMVLIRYDQFYLPELQHPIEFGLFLFDPCLQLNARKFQNHLLHHGQENNDHPTGSDDGSDFSVITLLKEEPESQEQLIKCRVCEFETLSKEELIEHIYLHIHFTANFNDSQLRPSTNSTINNRETSNENFNKSMMNALIHYSMKLPLTLTCDASAYGISGVLCHIVEGEEKPITFVSRTLSSAEVKYSQTEKEALAIVFATSKLRQYLFGRKFVLKSDHKALTTVFGNKRLLPPLIANRLHRWALELSNFDFDIRYTNKDTMLCADAFSRLPLEEMNSREDNIDLVTHDISFLNVTPLDHLIIEEETNKDPVLNKLKEYLLEDPQLAKKDETMKPFLSKLENFSVLQGCIFVDSRAVIPSTCQDQMLKLLHQSHIGINRMKSLARSSVWWPKMDSQIEEFVKECSPCMHHQTAPPAENTPWPRTNQPWQRVHVDHFYFRGDCYLLVVDANSNWIEVFPVRGTTSQENIKLLRECFARYGLPQCLVSDNGPPFNSIEFKEFLRKNNVYHLTSPAYNPSSNGIAEVSVRIIKKSLEKSLEESPNSNMDCILQNVLFNYRNTPTSLDKPPVERLLSYVPRTFVNCLNSEFIQKTFGRNECGRRHFQVGDKVMFTRVIQKRRKWFKAQVIRRLGYNVYLVKNLKGTFKVHVNQMRTGSDTKYAEDSDWTLDNAGAGPHRLEQDPQNSTTPPPRRSTRPRRPPCRFSPSMNNIRKEE